MDTYAYLEFEKPIAVLEKQLHDLKELEKGGGVNLASEITALEKKLSNLTDEIYANLDPWQRVQLSRHPHRPYTRDYIENLFPDFMEIHGDRCFGDDPALMVGFASFFGDKEKPILIMGQQKGRTTKQKMHRNFGMAKPEGYRKAMRAMDLANRSKIPILTFIDTPGAYPGLETEERGQAQAIAECIRMMFSLDVPICSVVIGEGGSGGALAIGIGNHVLMQQYSTYSVISPEGCASILWNDARAAEKASRCLKMTSDDLLGLGVIDAIIPEPQGGAQRNWTETFSLMQSALQKHMGSFFRHPKTKKTTPHHAQNRLAKFRKMGLESIS